MEKSPFEVHKNTTDESENHYKILQTLCADYANVFLIKSSDDTSVVITAEDETRERISVDNGAPHSYSEAKKSYLSSGRVHPEDVAFMTDSMRLERVKEELENADVFSGTFRVLEKDNVRYFQFKYRKVNDTDYIVLSFQNIDEMIADERKRNDEIKKLNARLQEEQAAKEKENKLIEALSSSFMNVYLVNVPEQTLEIYKLNGYVTKGLSKAKAGPYPYEATCKTYIDNRVYEPDKQMVTDYMRMENILQKLRENGEYEYTYRVAEADEIHFYEGKYVTVDEDCFVCGFQIVDDIVTAEKIRNQELENARKAAEKERMRVAEAYGMIYGLSQEYHTIWVVSKETSRMRLIRTSGISTIQNAVQMGKDYPEFDTGFERYIETYVEPQDRERMHREIAFAEILRQLEKSNVYAVNYLRRDDNGQVGYHQISFANADTPDGKKLFVYGFRDIDQITKEEQKQKEMLRKAKEEAEAANAAKTSFLFNMSHDIRTPMNAIIGFRDLLEKHQEDPVRRNDYLQKIEESSKILLSIINNVLEMARIEKGTLEIDDSAWSAEQFNDTLYSVFRDMMEQKRLTFTRQIIVSNNYVFCDPIKLREIFINILSNAYKYTNPGGKVNMHLEEIPFAEAPDSIKECKDESWAIYQTTITDTGIGMTEEFLPHIFDEFARESNTTEGKIEGTGLGMPIVKRLVEILDGTIEVKSKKGVGTTFIVTIPHRIAEKSNLTDHAGVELDPKLFEGKRILLTEDNDLNAEIAIEILSEVGFVVERARDGVQCCKMLSEAPDNYYDVILMDVQMPRMNGYEATRAIRIMSDRAKAGIPILAMTANAFEEDKREALRAGMNGHLAKPVNVRELMKELASVLG